MKPSKGFIYTFLCALSWAISIVLSRVVLRDGENPYNLAFWTVILASPYWGWVLTKELPNIKKLRGKDFFLITVMALISSVAVGFVEVFAIKNSTAINFSFLIRTVSLFTIVFAAIFLQEKITKKKIILLFTLLAGSFLLTTKGQSIHLARGDLFTLIEAALIAFGTNILAKFSTKRMTPDTASSVRFTIALLPVVLISATNTAIRIPDAWPLVIGITTVDIALISFMFRAFKYATASYVTMMMSFTPVLVTFIAVLLLKESLTPVQIIGGLLIVLAGIFVEKLKI